MPRYVAFLRGINVGGHRVKMDDLRRHVAALKFANITTFIASGNVIFDTEEPDVAALERRIEQKLERALGYEVATLIRTLPELAAVTRHRPFTDADMEDPAFARYVLFLRAALAPEIARALPDLRTKFDEFATLGRELYWLCRGKITQVSLAAKPFEKLMRAARVDATSRNLNTVQTIFAEFTPGEKAPPATTPQSAETERPRPSARARQTARRAVPSAKATKRRNP